jgi:hypothetical protein
VIRSEANGKKLLEICAITEEGLSYLLSQTSPKHVLEEFVTAMEARGQEVRQLVAAAKDCQTALTALETQIETAIAYLSPPAMPSASNGSEAWKSAALTFLAEWPSSRPNEDCPLPELFRHARRTAPGLTTGQFHDGLRQLYSDASIHLHPWTGPLSEIPDPSCAVLVGHSVAYYASKNNGV